MRLLTRRQVINAMLISNEEIMNKYCCPDCRDILSYNAVEGYYCTNDMCKNATAYKLEDIDDE